MPYKNIEINNATEVYQVPAKISHFYKGFNTIGASNSGTKLYDFDLIKQDILNHFNTRKGERVMNPRFGSIIWDLLMEPLTDDTKDALTQDISEICNSDPRVVPTRLNLTEYESGYILEITLASVETNQSTNMTLTFDQKNGLTSQ